jgi:hypothetical protein
MHARVRPGRPAGSHAGSAIDILMDALAACELPTSRRLPRHVRRQYRQRSDWKRILRRLMNETSIPDNP